MVEAGFSVIRIGESVWSTWEPEEGRFDLDWLAPILDGAAARGIAVILGTPTYAAPPWAGPSLSRDRRGDGHRTADALGPDGRRSTTPTRRSGSTPRG